MRFACVIRSGYLVLANQHTSSEGQGSRDLRQTQTELRLLATVQQNTNFRSHFESLTVYKSTYFDYLRTSFKVIVKFVVRKRNV